MKRFVCEKCGSSEIEVRAWVKPYENNRFSAYCESSLAETETAYCRSCGEWVALVEKEVEVPSPDPWRCRHCGSKSVQQMAWVDVNSLEIVSWIDDGRGDCLCGYCDEHSRLKRESELMAEIEAWFALHLQPHDNETISGLDSDDFASAEAFNAACKEKWNARDNERKIDIWRELTLDRPHSDDDIFECRGQTGSDDYVLVELPETDAGYFEMNGIGYPCFNSEDNGARYVPEEEYIRYFGKGPIPGTRFRLLPWPESQNYLHHSGNGCEVILANEKALADFGTSAVWVSLDLLKSESK